MEKELRTLNMDDTLHFEEKIEEEIATLKRAIRDLEKSKTVLYQEIKSKNIIIKMLRSDLKTASSNVAIDTVNHFTSPRNIIKDNWVILPKLQLCNRYSVLSTELSPSPPSEVIVTEAQVHQASTLETFASTPVNRKLVKA